MADDADDATATGAEPRPSLVRLERVGAVAIITLDRPDRHNAMGNAMDAQFWEALAEVASDDAVRAVVWRGAGPSFSSGRDVADLGIRHGESDYQYISAGLDRTQELLIPPAKPIVVAIAGWCIGGAFERALLCDVRFAAPDARFRLPELAHGLLPDSGGTAKLFQMCGHGVVADLVLSGRVLDAEEALRLGIVSRIVERDALDDAALELATTIAAAPPLAVRQHRELLWRLGGQQVQASVQQELLAQMLVYTSEDFAEFKAARAEGRAPRYRGT